ncbi:hypothetical protein BJ878DRAFT_544062 [Calycina marina]|uniref:F-box domain-containing protein n=1 Tax=Calycina marina TaxID=1763456 RepID=A0A9P7Z0H6_9HELO|nr:hypothetical protein BJ878DRAFT_544062 [Calycina marina]
MDVSTPIKNRKCYFLELSTKVRRRIYRYAGLCISRFFDLNKGIPPEYPKHPYSWILGKVPFETTKIPFNLMLVSHTVNEECTKIFYSENQFLVNRTKEGGLRPLGDLRDSTLSHVTHLTIHLNVECCGTIRYVDEYGFEPGNNIVCGNAHEKLSSCHGEHDPPIEDLFYQDEVIDQWRGICSRFATNVVAGQLSLYIIADCGNLETARRFVEPMLSFPMLQDCAVRLSSVHDKKIADLAKMIVKTLIKPSELQTFRFLDLPAELQIKILEHTPLASQSIIMSSPVGMDEKTGDPNIDKYKLDFVNWCSVAGRPSSRARYSGGCFCMTTHASYNNFCRCRDQATALSILYVCKSLHEAAIRVFYGQNHFKVLMQGWVFNLDVLLGSEVSSQYTMDDLDEESDDDLEDSGAVLPNNDNNPTAASRNDLPELDDLPEPEGWISESIISGLDSFPPDALKLLTRLTLDFNLNNPDLFRVEHPGFGNWEHTIDILSSEANLAILTLEIRFSGWLYICACPRSEDCQERIPGDWCGGMTEIYEGLGEPLLALKGIKNLFISMPWDFLGNKEPQEIESILEKMVMGDSYDAWHHGKEKMAVPFEVN